VLVDAVLYENSNDDEDADKGLLIGVPLAVLFLLASLMTMAIPLLVLVRRRLLMTRILRLPPPPCKC